jgi:anti-sigma B factor antagonist
VTEQREAPPNSAEASPAASSCVVSEKWDGGVVVVSAAGVVDMLTAPQLQECLKTALEQKPTGLVVDFTDVEFLASAGMGVLISVQDELPPDVSFCVVADGPATSRPLKLVGIADLIKLYATLDEALAAVTS